MRERDWLKRMREMAAQNMRGYAGDLNHASGFDRGVNFVLDIFERDFILAPELKKKLPSERIRELFQDTQDGHTPWEVGKFKAIIQYLDEQAGQ